MSAALTLVTQRPPITKSPSISASSSSDRATTRTVAVSAVAYTAAVGAVAASSRWSASQPEISHDPSPAILRVTQQRTNSNDDRGNKEHPLTSQRITELAIASSTSLPESRQRHAAAVQSAYQSPPDHPSLSQASAASTQQHSPRRPHRHISLDMSEEIIRSPQPQHHLPGSPRGKARLVAAGHGEAAQSDIHKLFVSQQRKHADRDRDHSRDPEREEHRSSASSRKNARQGGASQDPRPSKRAGSTSTTAKESKESQHAPTALRMLQRSAGQGPSRPYDPDGQSSTHGHSYHDGESRASSNRHAKQQRKATAAAADEEEHLRRDAAGSRSGGDRQLFDHRRHDPLTFKNRTGALSMSSTGGPGGSSTYASGSATSTSQADSRSLASTAHTSTTVSVTSSEASGGRRRRRGGDSGSEGPGSRTGDANEQPAAKAKSAANSEANSYVIELKKRYRDITTLELRLQDDNKKFLERGREKGAAGTGKVEEIDHQFWIELVARHKELAEAHVTFMEMSLRPNLPASLRVLPKDYSIPTRLWQTSFHMMLERLRHSLPFPHPSHPPPAGDEAGAARQAALLDHLTEFIYFAYSFYSNLHESETFRDFRSAWIESLGDLARYRMAVAGLSAALTARTSAAITSTKVEQKAASPPPPPRYARIDDDEDDDESAHGSTSLPRHEEEGNPAKVAPAPVHQPSIGTAALGEWDIEEKDTWRKTARDWYAKGLAEMPGTGRLQHHLGILSRMDELRALHHFCKSLATSHPFLSARESILPMFDRTLQMRRVQPDASAIDLFVHLHGMLFTRIELDNFNEVFARFKERLESETRDAAAVATPLDASGAAGGQRCFTQAEWMMMATINICSLLQYGAENALLLPPTSSSGVSKGRYDDKSRRTEKIQNKTPTAIMVNAPAPAPVGDSSAHKPKSSPRLDHAKLDGSDEGSDEAAEETDKVAGGAEDETAEVTIVPLVNPAEIDDELPQTLVHAVSLSFFMLSHVVSRGPQPQHFASRGGSSQTLPNPYLTLMATFLCTILKSANVLRLLTRYVPWSSFVTLMAALPDQIKVPSSISSKLTAEAPLPEDWCLRGLSCVRRVYERGFWKTQGESQSQSQAPQALRFESEVEVLTREVDPMDPEAAGELLGEADGDTGEDDAGAPRPSNGDELTLACLRWKRIAWALVGLTRTVPGLDLDVSDKRKAITIVDPLRSKIAAWEAEERKEREDAKREVQRRLAMEHEEVVGDGSSDDEEELDEADTSTESDSPELRALRERRRALLATLRSARKGYAAPLSPQRTIGKPSGKKVAAIPARPTIVPVPGYTILVLDTNILVAPGDLVQVFVESKRWTIVVPLAAITELDGLKHNATPLGMAALRALTYIEENIKPLNTWLKVQTSRGNYLRDLSIRREEIDFHEPASDSGLEGSDGTKPERVARSLDEIILRCAVWQEAHFVDRLGLLSADPAKAREAVVPQTPRVLLLTLDRNLRLKARVRGVVAAREEDLVGLLEGPVPG